MFNEAMLFLLDVLLQPFATILLLRFHLQLLRAPLRNPVGEFVMALTNFVVLRVRRFVPAVMGMDSATLLLALLVEMLYLSGSLWAQGFPLQGFPLPGLMLLAMVKLLKISLYLLMAAVFVQAILSWVNPYTSIAPLLNAITLRFLQPLRRTLPSIGNFDLSALLLFIICQLIVIVPIRVLEELAFGLL
jgi:YggT family protein